MSLLYGQLDEMDSSLDNLQAEVSDMAENDELWAADGDRQEVTYRSSREGYFTFTSVPNCVVYICIWPNIQNKVR